jgi:BirA family biotin operon repressor/biotin-[acetyl-CoA-carboxylase] ligase
MEDVPEDIASERIRSRLRTRVVGRRLEVLPVIDSTNAAAMAAGRRGEAEGLCVLADRQTAGRGRRGRTWTSLPGVGLYTSILLRPIVPAAAAPLLTLAAGLAVAEAICGETGLEPRLKWPNDVLLAGRKVAGILTELAAEGGRAAYVVVGAGINVNQRREDFPEALADRATSLRLGAGQVFARGDLAAALYTRLDSWYGVFSGGDRSAILAAARERMETVGRRVEVADGGECWEGLAIDLDGEGALLIRDDAGRVRRVLAGDVSIRDRA